MFRQIVVGTDGSAAADSAVDVAGGLSSLSGAQLHVVTVYEPKRAVVAAGAGASGGALAVAPDSSEEKFAAEEVVRRAGQRLESMGVAVHSIARRGEPADALLAVAEELGADLVVIGNRGVSSVRKYLLGNVADRVAHHAPCSVYIVHSS